MTTTNPLNLSDVATKELDRHLIDWIGESYRECANVCDEPDVRKAGLLPAALENMSTMSDVFEQSAKIDRGNAAERLPLWDTALRARNAARELKDQAVGLWLQGKLD